jgi:hypothetical protein
MAGFSDAGSWVTALSTGLNSLAASTLALSAAITTEQVSSKDKFYIKLRGNLASFAPSAGSAWIIHILDAVDSTPTNYADNCLFTRVAVGDFKSGTAAKYIYVPRRLLRSASFKIGFEHTSTVNMNASGSTIEYQMDTAS